MVETAEGVVVFTHAWWHADRTPEIDALADDQAALAVSRRRILEARLVGSARTILAINQAIHRKMGNATISADNAQRID